MSTNQSDDPKTVHCRRVDAAKTVEEHADCPYCFGKHDEIESEDRARFCSYDPDKDPIIYGFPPDSHRQRNG